MRWFRVEWRGEPFCVGRDSSMRGRRGACPLLSPAVFASACLFFCSFTSAALWHGGCLPFDPSLGCFCWCAHVFPKLPARAREVVAVMGECLDHGVIWREFQARQFSCFESDQSGFFFFWWFSIFGWFISSAIAVPCDCSVVRDKWRCWAYHS